MPRERGRAGGIVDFLGDVYVDVMIRTRANDEAEWMLDMW